jgi:hypothetical protein
LPESKRKFLARRGDRNDGRLISFGVPTPDEVIAAIRKLGGWFGVDKNKAAETLRLTGTHRSPTLDWST